MTDNLEERRGSQHSNEGGEEEEEPTVQVEEGILIGKKVKNAEGRSYYSFLGVPYAKPPVGPLRFKVAEKLDPWTTSRKATKHGNSAPQVNWLMKLPYRGDEDCLYLNVYTPKLPSENEPFNYAVMVWIHGGGYEVGSGDSSVYGPEYLVAEDVVVVTFNYRLGVLGFLSLESPIFPDNLGMKDQVAALRWVQANIASFGGDANNVTIFGNSAGGASVNYHLVSPMSKGLFQKAIMQSGCVLNAWAEALRPRELALQLAKELGCTSEDPLQIIKFLSDIPARDLVETHDNIKKKLEVGQRPRFAPVPETQSPDQEVFLPSSARKLMEQGEFHKVPCIIGCNSQEGILLLDMNGILKKPTVLRLIGEHLETQIPGDVLSPLSKEEIANKMKEFYFNDNKPDESFLKEYVDLSSDAWFMRGLVKLANIISASDTSVYFYHFDFSGKYNIYKNFLHVPYFTGAAHLDEVGYMFKAPYFKLPDVTPDSPEWHTLTRIVQMWTNFAKKGDPVQGIDDVIKIKWPSYSEKVPVYLNIKEEFSVKTDFNKERLEFWNKLEISEEVH